MKQNTLDPVVTQAVAFTEAYKQQRDAPKAIREAMCLKTQYPALMGTIQIGDLFAGRKAEDRLIYLGPIWFTRLPHGNSQGKQGGYCFDFSALERYGKTPEAVDILTELQDFWRKECTTAKACAQLEPEVREALKAGVKGQITGDGAPGSCLAPDLDLLIRRGLPGLYDDVAARENQARECGEDLSFYQGLRMALDVIVDVCRHYEKQALDLAQSACNEQEQDSLRDLAATLDAIVVRAPDSLREAIQLVWLYTLLAEGKHLEAWRLDQALGDFYVRDLERGTLDEEGALALVMDLWRMIFENGDPAVCRMVIGGKGRRNETHADRFALAAMEATRRHRQEIPQLTLRFHKKQNPELLRKAFDVIGEGGVFPTLYNDDAIIPGVSRIMDISLEEAASYYPLGCGEIMIGGRSPSLLNCVWNVPRTLDAVLHQGMDREEVRIGPSTGPLTDFDTYDKLYAAFLVQAEYSATMLARFHASLLSVAAEENDYLLASLLTHDCLRAGQPYLSGVRHLGACIMGHGFSNAADALYAIKRLVYEERSITLEQLVQALDNDYVGCEDLRQRLLACPKFGNDDKEADQTLVTMWQDINRLAKQAGKRHGFDFFTVSSVNPGGYWLGKNTGATADGRKKGDVYAIGHAPTAGRDRNGITALFKSLARVDPANGGVATNIKLSRSMFTRNRAQLDNLFLAFFNMGGLQASVTVTSQEDLREAMREPEKHANLMVRIGGWSARFVSLERDVQEDILSRTLY